MPDYSFLFQRAGFQVAESLLEVTPADSYLLVLLAGLVNTLTVVVVALPLATVLGIAIGLLRLSRHPLLYRAMAALVEPVRNTPVLLQLFVWYSLLLNLPGVHDAWQPVSGVYLSNRGLAVPLLHGALCYTALLLAVALAWWRWRRALVVLPALLLISLIWTPASLQWETPVLQGLGLSGGWSLSPEFTALVLGLALFHAAYISDIVRGAVLAVPLGQLDAARALGMRGPEVLRVAIYPYAARAAIPPYANQCLMLLKNSTLAIAIGYQELMAITNTTITQTGRALEGMALAAGLYLSASLLLAYGLARYNAHMNRHGIDGAGVTRLSQRWRSQGLNRATLWGSGARAGLSAVLLVAGVWLVWTCLRWALWDAVWTGSAQACEQARGACWAVIDANWRLLLFGTMAPEQRPAALLATLAVASAVAVAVSRRLAQRQRFGLTMLCVLAALLALSGFGTNHAPLAPVHWGGVLVTVVMAAAAITLALPLAVALALARRSQSKYLHRPALLLIEGVRAVPLAMQLLLAAFVIPVMLGGDWSASKFELALLALVLHTACLLAEVIRGALQAVPESQSLSAQALGMRPAMVLWSILLPQARRIASPAALGVFVGAVKDTSLVMIIGVFDILSAAKAVVADTGWRPFYLEVYAMVALFYFAVCLWLSRLAHRMQS